jgi:hypothetical protein
VGLALALFVATQYWVAWRMPFLGDDFVILDRVRDASFWDLWRTTGPHLFGWYRPVSRELHYWTLSRLAGTYEPAFHFVSFALWVALLTLFHRYVHRLAGARAAAIATAGAACLSVWGGPLVWIAGAQDLWMLTFGMAYLLAMDAGRTRLAALWLALALLSKESAVCFLAVAAAAAVARRGFARRKLAREFWPSLTIVTAWALMHPTLFGRITGHYISPVEASTRRSIPWAFSRALLATFGLDTIPRPEQGWDGAILLAVLACAPLLLIVLPAWKDRPPSAALPAKNLWWLGGVWALVGIGIALGPSLGWESYYAVIGLLGLWLLVGASLAGHRRWAIALVLAMGFVRAARATTPTWDWGSEWYQVRAGSLLRTLRGELQRAHPTLPPHARVYFTHIPNNVGLIAGDSPVLRVWYGDPTLEAHFLRDYRAPRPGEAPGRDMFFFYDGFDGLEELVPATEATRRSGLTKEAEDRYYNLATAMILGGEVLGAAREYLAIARGDPKRTDCAMFAAAAYQMAGRAAERDEGMALARAAGMSEPEIETKMRDLIAHFPRPRP